MFRAVHSFYCRSLKSENVGEKREKGGKQKSEWRRETGENSQAKATLCFHYIFIIHDKNCRSRKFLICTEVGQEFYGGEREEEK